MGATLNTLGLVANLAGVVLLFRYGMPYEVRTGGAIYLTTDQPDPAQARRETRYTVFGWIGLALIVAGTCCQIAGVWYA